jgi:gliding motility-associated-like protein
MKFKNSYLIFLASGFWLLASEIIFAQTFTITPTVTNVTCPEGKNGSASVSVSGGTLPYSYLWNDSAAQTSFFATGLSAGNYSVTIKDNTGKDSTITISVFQPQPFENNSQAQAPDCMNNGNIILNISGGTSPYNYLWNTGQTNIGIAQLGAGEYSVIVTDAKNCSISFSYNLVAGECFVSPEQYFTPNGDGIHDTWQIGNSQYYPDAKVIVFDRWGTRVYEHKGLYEPWDGKSYLGIPVPDAVYYYFFYEDKNDKEKKSTHGSVTIMR